MSAPAPVQLSCEPGLQTVKLTSRVVLRENFELKKGKSENTLVLAVNELKWVGLRPFDRVEYFTSRVFGLSTRNVVHGRLRFRYGTFGIVYESTTAGCCCVCSSEDDWRPAFTTVGRVGRVVSALRHHRQLTTTAGSAALCRRHSAACLRAVTTLGRWANGAANSRTLLCRRQWIAVESKDRCFDGE